MTLGAVDYLFCTLEPVHKLLCTLGTVDLFVVEEGAVDCVLSINCCAVWAVDYLACTYFFLFLPARLTGLLPRRLKSGPVYYLYFFLFLPGWPVCCVCCQEGWRVVWSVAYISFYFHQVDRSAAYAARWVAKSLVKAGLVRRCLVQVNIHIIWISVPLASVADPYQHDPDPGCEKIRSEFRVNFGTDPDPDPGKSYRTNV